MKATLDLVIEHISGVIQTVVNVAIQTERFSGAGVFSIGTAAVSDGHVNQCCNHN